MSHRRSDALRILVDGTIVKPDLGGYRTYVVELVAALADRGDCELHVATSFPETFPESPSIVMHPVSERVRNFAFRAAWRELALERLAERISADLIWAPVPEVPLGRTRLPLVATVHDVSQLVAPAMYGRGRFLRYLVALSRLAASATRVVCVSETTRGHMFSCLGVSPERSVVIGEGVRRGIRPVERSSAARKSDAAPFVLYVGSLMQHKNVATLVRAMAELPDDDPTELRLVGPATPEELAALQALVRTHKLEERVRHLGFVTTEELAGLYAGAFAFAFPSLIEGFGLPVLEAMTIGVPVVSSDIGAVREVAADAVRYVDRPLDPATWATALTRLRLDPEACERLVEDGFERARRWTWTDAADAYVPIFAEAAGAPRL